MKKFPTILILSLFSFAVMSQQNYHPSQFIAKIKPGVDFRVENFRVTVLNEKIRQLNANWNLISIDQIVRGNSNKNHKSRTEGLVLFSFANPIDIDQAILEYKALGLFEDVEPNFKGTGAGMAGIIPNDTYYSSRQWCMNNDGTFNNNALMGADISMEDAWELYTGNSNTIIAILDSGIKIDHPEFENRFWKNNDENLSNNLDDDNNGYINDDYGWDFVNDDNEPADDHGHGSNVTGIFAATGNNGIGYAGVNWKAKIMTGKILNSSNSGFYSDWIAAIYYSVDNGAEVINMSVGGSGFSAFMKDACDYAQLNDVAIFACMMNTDNDVPYYPAAYSSTIAIGATDTNDERVDPFVWSATSGSNYGNHIDLCAPGSNMFGLSHLSNSNYNSSWAGTSQASPLAAGVGSLLKGIDPTLTVEEIRSILRNTSDDQVGNTSEDLPGWDQYHGAGRLNAKAALESIKIPSAVNENSITHFFKLHPNPSIANNLVTIKTEFASEVVNVRIFDASGKLISIIQHSTFDNQIQFKAPSIPGTYFINLISINSKTESIKLMVTPE